MAHKRTTPLAKTQPPEQPAGRPEAARARSSDPYQRYVKLNEQVRQSRPKAANIGFLECELERLHDSEVQGDLTSRSMQQYEPLLISTTLIKKEMRKQVQ